MNVVVTISLSVEPERKHWDVMQDGANHLTNDKSSVNIFVSEKKKPTIIAEFTIKNARQMDVVDRIGKEFSLYMEDYQTSSISFPRTKTKRRK